jgi:hypothetical protein
MCPQYWENPTLYTIADEQPLKERYAHLGMKDNSDLRLDSLCAVRNPEKPDTLAALTY